MLYPGLRALRDSCFISLSSLGSGKVKAVTIYSRALKKNEKERLNRWKTQHVKLHSTVHTIYTISCNILCYLKTSARNKTVLLRFGLHSTVTDFTKNLLADQHLQAIEAVVWTAEPGGAQHCVRVTWWGQNIVRRRRESRAAGAETILPFHALKHFIVPSVLLQLPSSSASEMLPWGRNHTSFKRVSFPLVHLLWLVLKPRIC